MARAVIQFDLPFWRPWGVFLRATYLSAKMTARIFRWLLAVVYYGPIFKSYCVSCGRNLYLELVPSIAGPVKLFVGNNLYISGALEIAGGNDRR